MPRKKKPVQKKKVTKKPNKKPGKKKLKRRMPKEKRHTIKIPKKDVPGIGIPAEKPNQNKTIKLSDFRDSLEKDRFWGVIVGGKKGPGKISIDGKNLKRLKPPKTRKEFLLNVSVGRLLAQRDGTLTKKQIIKKYGITEGQLNKKIRELAPIVRAGRDKLTKNILNMIGNETGKGDGFE